MSGASATHKGVTIGHWNHRLIEWEHNGEKALMVHEVFYDEHGRPMMYNENGSNVVGENLDELKAALAQMAKALDAPVLKPSDFPEDARIN